MKRKLLILGAIAAAVAVVSVLWGRGPSGGGEEEALRVIPIQGPVPAFAGIEGEASVDISDGAQNNLLDDLTEVPGTRVIADFEEERVWQLWATVTMKEEGTGDEGTSAGCTVRYRLEDPSDPGNFTGWLDPLGANAAMVVRLYNEQFQTAQQNYIIEPAQEDFFDVQAAIWCRKDLDTPGLSGVPHARLAVLRFVEEGSITICKEVVEDDLIDNFGREATAEERFVYAGTPGFFGGLGTVALGNGPEFDFTGDLGDFTLADGECETFDDLTPDEYEVIEVDPSTLVDIECDDPDAIIDIGAGSVLIDLDPDEDVTCTFFDEEEEIIIE